MVQERPDGRANIIYDLPSTQILGQDKIPELAKACAFVDEKIEQLMRYVSGPLPNKDEKADKLADKLEATQIKS
jgi:hypothetical protein